VNRFINAGSLNLKIRLNEGEEFASSRRGACKDEFHFFHRAGIPCIGIGLNNNIRDIDSRG
jgi:hypothetical protein